MNPKHTPGPWRIIEWDSRVHVTTPDNGLGTQPAWDIWGTAEHHNGVPREIGQANARLIAEAPALLALAKECERLLADFDQAADEDNEGWTEERKALEELRATIARAEGRA